MAAGTAVTSSPGRDMLARVWADLGREPSQIAGVRAPVTPVPIRANMDVASLAWASVAAASLSAATLSSRIDVDVDVDPERVAVAYASERVLRIDHAQPSVWAPLSGFFRSADGWVRTHGNYPHHASALRRGLELPEDAGVDAVSSALQGVPAAVAAQAIASAGGLCVAVAREQPIVDAELRTLPLVGLARAGSARVRPREQTPVDAPLRGIRVLDLTRVIAGPVATRALALLGADVLRVDPPRLPEPEWQHLDTGHGKRSTLLDLRAPADHRTFPRLVARADVIVTGYRAAAMNRLGMNPEALIAEHPGLIVARLTAWGSDAQTADRRGFDSLVQAASGISWIESADGDRPGALPVQALDHSAGYLLAAGVMSALEHRGTSGGSWIVDVSLRRVAAELLGMPRSVVREPAETLVASDRHLQEFDVEGRRLTTAGPAIAYAGGPRLYRAPRHWGGDEADWAGGSGSRSLGLSEPRSPSGS